MSELYHIPVLVNEVIHGLQIKPEGIYVDCTFGGGGHSKEILKNLSDNGKLVAFDHDVEAGKNVPPDDDRIIYVPHNFRHLQRFLRLNKVNQVDGILADLGVSSHQLDVPERGFSTRFDAALDMRMDKRQELTAFEIMNTYTEERLHKLFELYGEVSNSKTLAKTIVQMRQSIKLRTISDFKNAVRALVKGNPNKYFAKVFQSLRIEVNDELGSLKELLQQVPSALKTSGRIAIITFHSLEDRIVKNFFKKGTFEVTEDINPYAEKQERSLLKPVTKKPIVPDLKEIENNPRSRSAKLRIAERVR